MSDELRVCSTLGCRSELPLSQMVRKATSAKPFSRLICPKCATKTTAGKMRRVAHAA